MAWLAVMSCVGFAAQMAVPAWVRARALGVYLLVFQGLLAAGSFGWGALAQQFGTPTALTIAALALVGGVMATWRWQLRQVHRLDLNPSEHWPGPRVAITPDPEDGPVLVTVEYRVSAARAGEFLAAMAAMQRFRRREGAVRWDLFRDLGDPDRYLETFLVLSWGEHLRQHARVTMEDEAIEARAFSFLQAGVEPVATHLIAAHVFAGRTPAEAASAAIPMDIALGLQVGIACRHRRPGGRRAGARRPPELLESEAVYELRLDLRATANVLLPGHHIWLGVSSSNFPRFGRNGNTDGAIVSETGSAYRRRSTASSMTPRTRRG